MKSRDYWLQREKAARDNAIMTEERYKRELMKYCDLMQDSIEKEINAFYGKYAAKEGISIAEAKKRADKLDIEAYAKKAKEYVDTHDLSDQANEEMRLYNLTMKVNRLELLKANIGLEMIKNFEDLTNALEDDMTEEARETYERLAGILGNTIHGNEKQIKSLVNASFKGARFDENIWGYETALKSQLTTKITQGLIQGKSAQELARSLRKDFDTTRYQAERLMRTELARVRVQAQLDSYEQAGIEEYEFINFSSAAYAGGPICPVCSAMDGKHFPIRDFMPGENAPPMHPNCRCSTVPYVGELLQKVFSSRGAGGDIPSSGKSKVVATIDFSDKKLISRVLEYYENLFSSKNTEWDATITPDGEVWVTPGGTRGANTETITSDRSGAYSYHNHLPEESEHSFSEFDIASYMEYDEYSMTASDDKYRYTMRRTNKTPHVSGNDAYTRYLEIYRGGALQRVLSEDVDADDYRQHYTMIELAKEYHLEYERVRKVE